MSRTGPDDGKAFRLSDFFSGLLETTRNQSAKLRQSLPILEADDETFGVEFIVNNEITRLILPHFEKRLDHEFSKEQATSQGISHADLFGGIDAAESLVILSRVLAHLEEALQATIEEIGASTEERFTNPFRNFCANLIPIYEELFAARAAASEGNSSTDDREFPDAGPAVRFILHCLEAGKRNGIPPDGTSLPSVFTVAGWIGDYNKDRSTTA